MGGNAGGFLPITIRETFSLSLVMLICKQMHSLVMALLRFHLVLVTGFGYWKVICVKVLKRGK